MMADKDVPCVDDSGVCLPQTDSQSNSSSHMTNSNSVTPQKRCNGQADDGHGNGGFYNNTSASPATLPNSPQQHQQVALHSTLPSLVFDHTPSDSHMPSTTPPSPDCYKGITSSPDAEEKTDLLSPTVPASPFHDGGSKWTKIRTTVKIAGAVSNKKKRKGSVVSRQDSFMKRFSTRHQGNAVISDDDSQGTESENTTQRAATKLKEKRQRHYVINPDENFMFYWLAVITLVVLYNLWTCIARQAFREIQEGHYFWVWITADAICDFIYVADIAIQLRTGYLERGLIVYNSAKLAKHYVYSSYFVLDMLSLLPLDLLQLINAVGIHPLLRFPRFLKAYRSYRFVYMVETRTVYPNLWRVANLSHVLFLGSHWFAAFYFMISEAEGFNSRWSYPTPIGEFDDVTRKYLQSLYWSTLTLTTIGDLPKPTHKMESEPEPVPLYWYVFTIASYLIGVFVFATIVGQVGNVITNRNASRQEFERLLDSAKAYMRNQNVPMDMQRRVQRWYDYAWSRGRMNGGGDINSLRLLPDKLKTELALQVNLETLRKVTIFQECEPEFLHDLVLKMKAFIFTPGDLICRKGEIAREMFIIADGLLEVISDTCEVLTQMNPGDFFGEIGILNLDGGVNRRTADVRSVGYSELFVLSRDDVLSALKDHPEAEELIKAYGRQRLQEITAHNQKRIAAKLAKRAANAPEEKTSLVLDPVQKMVASSTDLLKQVIQLGRKQSRSAEDLNSLEKLRQKYENGIMPSMPMGNHTTHQYSSMMEPSAPVTQSGTLLQRVLNLGQQQTKPPHMSPLKKQISIVSALGSESEDSDADVGFRKQKKRHVRWPLMKQSSDDGRYRELPADDPEEVVKMRYDCVEDEASPICHSIAQSLTSLEKSITVEKGFEAMYNEKPIQNRSRSLKMDPTEWSTEVKPPKTSLPGVKSIAKVGDRVRRSFMGGRNEQRRLHSHKDIDDKSVSFDNPIYVSPDDPSGQVSSLRKVHSEYIYVPSEENLSCKNSSLHSIVPSPVQELQQGQASHQTPQYGLSSLRRRGYNSLPRRFNTNRLQVPQITMDSSADVEIEMESIKNANGDINRNTDDISKSANNVTFVDEVEPTRRKHSAPSVVFGNGVTENIPKGKLKRHGSLHGREVEPQQIRTHRLSLDSDVTQDNDDPSDDHSPYDPLLGEDNVSLSDKIEECGTSDIDNMQANTVLDNTTITDACDDQSDYEAWTPVMDAIKNVVNQRILNTQRAFEAQMQVLQQLNSAQEQRIEALLQRLSEPINEETKDSASV